MSISIVYPLLIGTTQYLQIKTTITGIALDVLDIYFLSIIFVMMTIFIVH